MANCEECKNRIGCENYAPKSTTACEHYAEEVRQLKPCPFCGGEAVGYEDNYGKYLVGCPECGAMIGIKLECGEVLKDGWKATFNTIEEAFDAWNRRADNAKL